MYFLFNRTTLQVFVTYLTGALYMHLLWLYKHQHDNRVRSKLFVAYQRWWSQWRFWFVPSVPGYLPEEEEHKPYPWHNPTERNHMGLHLENEVAVVKTPTVISNNSVCVCVCVCVCVRGACACASAHARVRVRETNFCLQPTVSINLSTLHRVVK